MTRHRFQLLFPLALCGQACDVRQRSHISHTTPPRRQVLGVHPVHLSLPHPTLYKGRRVKCHRIQLSVPLPCAVYGQVGDVSAHRSCYSPHHTQSSAACELQRTLPPTYTCARTQPAQLAPIVHERSRRVDKALLIMSTPYPLPRQVCAMGLNFLPITAPCTLR